MKWSLAAVALVTASSTTNAFTVTTTMGKIRAPPTQLNMSLKVGIVGGTGAVGKEIRQCLENRNFPVSELHIFGSERSAGRKVETEKFGDLEIELFEVDKARECDVVFLAVSGDFAKEHAKALADGDSGCVVIDNSVRYVFARGCR